MSLRQNVRNYLLPLTISEVKRELELSQVRGDVERVKYIEEILREIENEKV